MPGRLIALIIALAILLAFITFNLDNKCDISFWFKVLILKDVPVYLTVFTFYALGLLTSLPFFIKRKKKNDSVNIGAKEEKSGLIFEKKNPIWAKKAANDKKKMEQKENSPYDNN